MKKRHNTRFSFIIIFLAAVILIWSHGPALAHKVTIFAWVEGDTVFTESKFSGGKRAVNAPVVIYGRDGKKLLEGKTDNKGEFSFKIPEITDLRVVLNATMGHKAPSGTISVGLSKEEIQKVVEDSLDKKLRPIVRMMTESKNAKPSITEIIGGIGYIFGLFGVVLFFKNRIKKRQDL